MRSKILLGICTAALFAATGVVFSSSKSFADEVTREKDVVVVKGKRANRISKGATGLPIDIKETPQTISIIGKEQMRDFATTGSNDALRLGTGINVEQYETNRSSYNARGFDIQLTQIDGIGMSNDWGTVVGQQDTYLFDKIELIRGANGLLTGVGNSSGTINYVRKRPKNEDSGEINLSGGSYDLKRASFDYNKVLNDSGTWAGRLVVAHEDKESYLRGLDDVRSTIYGVVDGQIGEKGVLTLGYTYQKSNQNSPMWGALTLNYIDGSKANFDVSASTSQDWAFWDTKAQAAFIEYTHQINANWEGRVTYNYRKSEEEVRLLYAFPFGSGLNFDNTGLYGWPYGSFVTTENKLLDASVNGKFGLFGREHNLIAGISHSNQKTETDLFSYDTATYQYLPLPAFPYAGDVYPEPIWGPRTPSTGGEQTLTRIYIATRINLSERLNAIFGLNAIKLEREGSSRYGNIATVAYPETKKTSPYFGLTYDFNDNITGYVSYSDIFQNQDQNDINGSYLAPMQGVNYEAGIKSEWLNKRLIANLAVFSAEQKGLATYAGVDGHGNYYYSPADVESKGIELEVIGRISKSTNVTFGVTNLKLTGNDGKDIYEWVPRTTVNFMIDTRPSALPKLKLGLAGKWQSDVSKIGGASQDSYAILNGFTSYDLTDVANIRLNINNLLDKKYVNAIQYGGYYGAPRNVSVTFGYKF